MNPYKKHFVCITVLLSIVAVATSCSDWLEQENKTEMTEQQTYTDDAGIQAVAANLYARMTLWQDFAYDSESYDLCRWDEAINNSQYWSFATNATRDYRVNYDYTYIRELNQHIYNLETISKGSITESRRQYYIAEGRWLRAWMYFTMIEQLGGVPIITEVTKHTTDPTTQSVGRNTEAECYDFIISEMDAIKDLLGNSTQKTRATKGAALALKSRAALYAGTLALNHDRSEQLNLNLKSGATGIEKSRAEGYLQTCIEAVKEIESMGQYSLYQAKTDLSENYADIFVSDYSLTPEIIFCKAYDGVNQTNYFTQRCIARSVSKADLNKTSCQVCPVLNLVDCYENLITHKSKGINAYAEEEQIEGMTDRTTNAHYILYDNPNDIFAGLDPRLQGTVLCPGASFRGQSIDLRAGLAIPTTTGYELKSATSKTALATDNTYCGQQMTGFDGPLTEGQPNYYISHTGFLLRKYIDSTAGSELNGASEVAYIVFRYAEMLLNAAEASFYLGDTSAALDYINRVRERAGGSQFRINSSELTLERIKNERRVELAFENHRYIDMKRWRDADETWNYVIDSPTATLYALWPYKIYAPGQESDGKWIFRKVRVGHRVNTATISFTRDMYYSAYPQNEGNPLIEKNPNH